MRYGFALSLSDVASNIRWEGHLGVVSMRATSHKSQEPWPCNDEDPWLSSKSRTMGVGKAVLCNHRPSSIVWSEKGSCCRTIAYFIGGKEGRIWFNIICPKLYQFKRITWWCLSVLESITDLPWNLSCWNKKSKSHSLVEFGSSPPPRGGPDKNSRRPWNLIYSPPCRTPCILFIHEVFFGPLGLHLRVWSELGPSVFLVEEKKIFFFRPLIFVFFLAQESSKEKLRFFLCPFLDSLRPFDQWELLDCNGHRPSVLCVKWPWGHYDISPWLVVGERGAAATNSPPTLTSAGHQWTVSTSTGCNQWSSLARPTLKVAPAGRNCSLVARTNKCGWAISSQTYLISQAGDEQVN